MENSVCSKCQRPLVTSEEISRRLCAECVACADSVEPAGCADSADRGGAGSSAGSACSAEFACSAGSAEYTGYAEGSAGDAQMPVLPGIRPACGYHPEAEAIGICSRCGTFICDECRLDCTDPASGQTAHYCRDCYERVEEASYYCAWEDKSIFFYERFWLTWRDIIFHPYEFFDKLPRSADKTSALTFSYLSFAHILFFGVILFYTSSLSSLPGLITETLGLIGLTALWLVVPPVLVFGNAAVIHVGIRLLSEKREFHQTVRIVGYSSATQVLSVIPMMGIPIISKLSSIPAAILHLFIVISGVKRVHRLSTGQAILAVLVTPFLFGLTAGILFVLILVGAFGLR
jgi:hypothetical protein